MSIENLDKIQGGRVSYRELSVPAVLTEIVRSIESLLREAPLYIFYEGIHIHGTSLN